MKLIIPGRLPCMNDLIAANRLNKYAGGRRQEENAETNYSDSAAASASTKVYRKSKYPH